MNTTKSFLVTGGAGFIGSHLADALIKKGYRVIVFDNESTGLRQNVPGKAVFYHGDVRNPEDLEVVYRQGLDGVFHIAGQASIVQSFKTPVDDLATNVAGTINVLQACIQYKVPRLLFASSMTVYGNPKTQPVPENEFIEPISYYGITKFAAESYVTATARRNDLSFPLNVTSFRMFNVYGERQRLDNPYQGVLGFFLGNLLRQEPICIYGDGEQTRDFIYIRDVVKAWISSLDNPSTYGQVFNLGFGEGTSINKLVDAVLAAGGLSRENYPVVYGPERPGDIRCVAADILRISRAVGWRPNTKLVDGIKRTLTWAINNSNSTSPGSI